MSVELPKDANGEVIPFDTVALFGGNGNAYSIRCWVYTTDFDLGDSMAGQWRALTDKGTRLDPELMYLTPPDSWKKLEEDLDRCIRADCLCPYDLSEECAECTMPMESQNHCNSIALEDIKERIRRLRGDAK